MITLEAVRSSYKSDSKFERERKEWFTFFVLRPLSHYVTYLLLRLNCSGLAATLLRFPISLCGIVLAASGDRAFGIAGGLLIFFHAILDCVDGNICRFRKQKSYLGTILDVYADAMTVCLVPLALGAASFSVDPGRGFLDPFLGAIAAFLMASGLFLHHALNHYIILAIQAGRTAGATQEAEAVSGRGDASASQRSIWYRIAMQCYRAQNRARFIIFSASGIHSWAVLAAYVFDILRPTLFAILALNALYFLTTLSQSLRAAYGKLNIPK